MNFGLISFECAVTSSYDFIRYTTKWVLAPSTMPIFETNKFIDALMPLLLINLALDP